MSIAFSSLNFTGPHGVPLEGDIEAPVQVYRVPGIVGEVHLVDRAKSARLSVDVRFRGYASPALLQAAVDTFNAKIGTNDANTSITFSGAFSQTISSCTFLGFSPKSPIMYDGTGVNGWHRKGEFMFIRRLS